MASKKELIFKSMYKTGFVIAFCLSMGVCGPFGATGGMIIALISAVFLNITPETLISPMLTEFLILSFAASKTGPAGTIAVTIPGVIIMLAVSRSDKFRKIITESGLPGIISLFTALAVTILVTNTYFGIGASGDTVIDMLRSYRSLGFHPNWRGILYGTIVMVIMITFPRKFKKAKNIMNMAFAAVVITYILNLLLTVKSLPVPFEEAGNLTGKLFDFSIRINGIKIFIIIMSALAFGITAAVSLPGKAGIPACAGTAVSAAASSVFGCPVTAEGNSSPSGYISGIISAVAAGLIFIVTKGFARLPAASCAVVLIVAAWQSLDKPSIKLAFKGGRAAVSAIIILAALASNPAPAVLLPVAVELIKSAGKPAADEEKSDEDKETAAETETEAESEAESKTETEAEAEK